MKEKVKKLLSFFLLMKRRLILSGLLLLLLVPSTSLAGAMFTVDKGSDSWGGGIGFAAPGAYFLMNISMRDEVEPQWDNSYNSFEDDPYPWWNYKGEYYRGGEYEIGFKVGYSIYKLPLNEFSHVYLNGGLGYSTIDTVDIWYSTATGWNWGKESSEHHVTALLGIAFQLNRNFLLYIDGHTRRGIVSGIGLMF